MKDARAATSRSLGAPRARSRSEFLLALRQIFRNRLAAVGALVLFVLGCIIVVAPALPLANPLAQDMSARVSPASMHHWLGTDSLGRDVLARLIFGARTSLVASGGSVVLAIGMGLPLGFAAGYYGGRTDGIIMRGVDAILSFPAVVLAIAVVATLGPGEENVVLAIGLVNMPVFARLARAAALVTRSEMYVEAAAALGANDWRIVTRHIVPSATGPVTIQIGATFAVALVAEATLSFLGLGARAPAPSWGMMLNDARPYISDGPWLIFFPAAWISVTVLAINFLADGLRDALDPHYRVE
jgi:peptide/nickel transport system permease protein